MSETKNILTKIKSRTYQVLFLLSIIYSFTVSAQQDSIIKSYKRTITRFTGIEKGFGLTPEIDFINGTMGVGICRGKFILGTRTIAGTAYQAGLAFDTKHELLAANFGYWLGYFKKKFGGQVGLKGIYYANRKDEAFVIRPEAGIGMVKAQLSYGYNFSTVKSEMKLPTHTLTLMFYFGIHSVRYKTY